MWIQLEPEAFENLAILAESAKLSDVAMRIRHSLLQQRQTPNLLEAYRREARTRFSREGLLEIDDDAAVSQGDDAGAYVMAWHWIESPESARSETTSVCIRI